MTAQIQIPQLWDLSCRDWQTRIRNRQSIIPDLPLFTSEADMAVAIFDNLRLPDVVGEPLLRDAVRDWFRQIVRAVFGSRDPKTNQRFIREMLAMVPKGQAKTTYCAALLVVAMVMNLRPRAEMMFVGETQSVADFAYDQAVGMVQADPELKRRFRPVPHKKEIKDLFNGAKLKVKTFDLSILTGSKPVFVLLDELHLLGKNHHAAKVIRQIRGGLEKNPEGFLIMTTTQSDEAPTGVFKDELILARKIRDGEFQGRMLPVLYEFPKDIAADPEQWQNPDNWSMVMPNLGISIQPDSRTACCRIGRPNKPKAHMRYKFGPLNISIYKLAFHKMPIIGPEPGIGIKMRTRWLPSTTSSNMPK